jgi:hypothetical protein
MISWMTTGPPPLLVAAPVGSVNPLEPGFVARYRAELSTRSARLFAACLVTLVVLWLATHAERSAGAGVARPLGQAAAPVAALPGDAAGWRLAAQAAAAECPGLRPEVLVAIGHVETRLGRGLGPSAAGALGPMQFLPSTWAVYGTDGDGDGRADIMDPVDSLHSAARLLCANGGASPGGLRSALWRYNHSPRYVEAVMSSLAYGT